MTTGREETIRLLLRVADGYGYRSAAFRRTFARGGLACLAGDAVVSCPYRGGRGWGRVYRQAWVTGWRWTLANIGGAVEAQRRARASGR